MIDHLPMRLAAAILTLAAAGAFAADAPVAFPPAMTPDMLDHHTIRAVTPERVGSGKYRIGDIILDKAEKSVSFPAALNMNKGLLEYLLVRRGGKTHESLLRTDVEPYNLQLACLLVGLEGTDAPLAFQGDPAKPRGEAVEILIKTQGTDGKEVSLRPESWLIQTAGEDKRDVPLLNWVYTGSLIHDGRFAAQAGGSIVALFHDPGAMFDNASPGGESDKIWFVKTEALPAVGTPVTVTIRSRRK